MGTSELTLPNSNLKSLADSLGVSDLTLSMVTSESSQADANIQDVVSFISHKSEVLCSNAGVNVDLADTPTTIKFGTSKTTARTLATVTTTVTNPVCYRYDTATSTYVTTGVTTVDNGTSVSCTSTLPGTLMVMYVSTTTTTTTADPGSSDSGSNIGLIVGLVVGLVILAVAVILIIVFVKKAKAKRNRRHATQPMFVEDGSGKDWKNAEIVSQDSNLSKGKMMNPNAPSSAIQMQDQSVTEMRPMAAGDMSLEMDPSAFDASPVHIPKARRSYSKIQQEGGASPEPKEEQVFPVPQDNLPPSELPSQGDVASETGSGQGLIQVKPSDNIGVEDV